MNAKDIKRKAINGFLFLFITMGLAIFLPARSLNYWQEWVYWFIFSSCCFYATIYFLKNDLRLIESRLSAGPVSEKEISQKIIQSFASIFFIAMLVIPGFDFRYHWSEIPSFLVIIADGFVFLGFWIIFLVFKENSFASSIIEVGSDQKVISTGPYRLVRHPMYSGGILLCMFTPIALGSYLGIIPACGVSIVIVFRLLDEEEFLSYNLEGYKEYCEKVCYRLIPWIW
jgi:protein-S-isoprenylcysteine O-methyltransferase Ste14